MLSVLATILAVILGITLLAILLLIICSLIGVGYVFFDVLAFLLGGGAVAILVAFLIYKLIKKMLVK